MTDEPHPDWRYPHRLKDDPYFGQDPHKESKRLERAKMFDFKRVLESLQGQKNRTRKRKA